MTESGSAVGPPLSRETTGRGSVFGLDDAERADLLVALAGTLSIFGLDGAAVVTRLDAGAPLYEALSLPAGTVDLLYARAHNWFTIGRHDRAESLFRTLCALDGCVRDHWLGYGICLKTRGQHAAAEMVLRIAVQIEPESALPHYHLLDLAMRRGTWDCAAEHLAVLDRYDHASLPSVPSAELSRYRAALLRRMNDGVTAGRSPL